MSLACQRKPSNSESRLTQTLWYTIKQKLKLDKGGWTCFALRCPEGGVVGHMAVSVTGLGFMRGHKG